MWSAGSDVLENNDVVRPPIRPLRALYRINAILSLDAYINI